MGVPTRVYAPALLLRSARGGAERPLASARVCTRMTPRLHLPRPRLGQLVAMGIEREAAQRALVAAGGELAMAVEIALSQ